VSTLSAAALREPASRLAFRAWLVAAPVFVGLAAVASGGLFRERGFVDVDLYGTYTSGLLDGRLPYRDVFVEYPPGAFVVLLPPALVSEEHYRSLFKLLMAAVALGGLWCVARLAVALGLRGVQLAIPVGAVALSPLVLGSVWLNSYDPWPSALTVAALLALVCGPAWLAFACLALAFVAKVYAVILVPPALVFVSRLRGRREAVAGAAVFAGLSAAVAAPFLAISPGGVWESFRSQAERGLHIESLGSSILLAGDRIGIYQATVASGGTQASTRDLTGALPDVLAAVSTGAAILAVLVAWALFARGAASPERLVVCFGACVAGVLAFSKVLSPQYLEWLLFVVPLAAGVAGAVVTGLMLAAFLLGELWFHSYRELYAVGGRAWLVPARDVLLVVLYGALLVRLNTTTPSRSNTTLQSGLRRRFASARAAGTGDVPSR
jgi:hypothetical protein